MAATFFILQANRSDDVCYDKIVIAGEAWRSRHALHVRYPQSCPESLQSSHSFGSHKNF